jgi:hypothetical protein
MNIPQGTKPVERAAAKSPAEEEQGGASLGGKAKPHSQPRPIAAYRDSSSTSDERSKHSVGQSKRAPGWLARANHSGSNHL